MEFVNIAIEFVEYLIEHYGVFLWTVIAFVILAWGRELKELYKAGKIDTQMEILVYRLVLAAEQLVVDGDGKYKWVSESLGKMVPGMTEEQIRMWIDSTVRIMKTNGQAGTVIVEEIVDEEAVGVDAVSGVEVEDVNGYSFHDLGHKRWINLS